MKKTEFLESLKNVTESKVRNSMGISESYYNPIYLMAKCFEYDYLESLEESELNNLYKLADFASEVFY